MVSLPYTTLSLKRCSRLPINENIERNNTHTYFIMVLIRVQGKPIKSKVSIRKFQSTLSHALTISNLILRKPIIFL